jgi:alpha-L-arabinofuranosidase
MLVNSNQIVKTPLFHVFKRYGEWMRGEAVNVMVESPKVQANTFQNPNRVVPETSSSDRESVDLSTALRVADRIHPKKRPVSDTDAMASLFLRGRCQEW